MGQIGPGFLSLPYRTPKPRSDGLTHVLDKGLSLFALESLIQTAGDAIDIVKLGWGTSYVSDGVKAKVGLCRAAGIHLSPGGTLLEICEYQGRITDYVRWLQRLGVTHVIDKGLTLAEIEGLFDPHSDSTVKCRDSIRISARLRLVSIPNAPLDTSTCRTPRRSSHRW